MLRKIKYIILILFLTLGGYFWFENQPDVHKNLSSDISLLQNELSGNFSLTAKSEIFLFVVRIEDLGTPFNHQAVDFIYLDSIIEDDLFKENVLKKFRGISKNINSETKTYLNYALSLSKFCNYTKKVKIENDSFCDNEEANYEYLSIKDDESEGFFVIFHSAQSNIFLLRRFWAFQTKF